jgi:hypothetical protein
VIVAVGAPALVGLGCALIRRMTPRPRRFLRVAEGYLIVGERSARGRIATRASRPLFHVDDVLVARRRARDADSGGEAAVLVLSRGGSLWLAGELDRAAQDHVVAFIQAACWNHHEATRRSRAS